VKGSTNSRCCFAKGPPGTVCGNDVIAYGALREAERSGLHVPDDLSVMGFDDLEWSRPCGALDDDAPAAPDEVWSRAGEYLVRTLNGQPAALHREGDASLVVRESTSPPRVQTKVKASRS